MAQEPLGRRDGEPEARAREANQLTLGLQFALTILLFVGAGWWLDAKLGTSPWLLLLLLLLGFVGAFVSLVRRVFPADQEKARKRADRRPPEREDSR